MIMDRRSFRFDLTLRNTSRSGHQMTITPNRRPEIALTFLIVGLVTRKLPAGFANPAAFGDLIALVLAYIAFIGLQRSRAERPRLLPVWILNVVGTADLLFAFATAPFLIKDPGSFGLTYIIPTVYVPLLLTAHFYAFKVLAQPHAPHGRRDNCRTEDAITDDLLRR